MKVRIECNKEDYVKIRQIFESNGFEISTDARFVFTEIGFKKENIRGYDISGDKHIVDLNNVIIIQTGDYKNIVKTITNLELFTDENLYYFETNQFSHALIRINKSQIINLNHIVKVSYMVNSRLKLTLRNKDVVYVTRPYIKAFKTKFE